MVTYRSDEMRLSIRGSCWPRRAILLRARGREGIECGFMLLPLAIHSRLARPVQEPSRRLLVVLLLLLAGMSITGSLAVFSSKLLGVGVAS